MRHGVTLILGGARSGKSAWAEEVAAASGRPVIYLATAAAGDAEMAERIAAHQAARPSGWRTVEAPLDPAGAIRTAARPGDIVLVDCLTLWVSNRLLAGIAPYGEVEDLPVAAWPALEGPLLVDTQALLDAGRAAGAALVLVSNEVGLGLVPPYPLGRRYRDLLGRVNQVVARQADRVVLMIAGLPVDLRRLLAEPAFGGDGRDVS